MASRTDPRPPQKLRLLTPGPTPIPERVALAMARPIIHHRTGDFRALFAEIQEGLRWLLGAESDVLVLACTGTGAMESAVANLLSPGDLAITVNAGKFGARWGKIARAYGAAVVQLDVPWGEAVTPAAVVAAVREHPQARAVFLQATETSTGVSHPVREIARRLAGADLLTVVDGITAVGVDDLRQERDRIDVLITSSQKALMLPPGLACVGVRQRVWPTVEAARSPRYYFDWRAERAAHTRNQTAFTPATAQLLGLREALAMLKEEGLASLWARHDRLARMARAGAAGLGLTLVAKASPSRAVTAVYGPQGCDTSALVSHLRARYGVTMAGGQAQLKGRIFRIAHLGYVDRFDVIVALTAVAEALTDLGHPLAAGAAIDAALQESRR